jgi:hypothetical protein
MSKQKVAVIIKHPYRDWDYRVDIVEVDDTVTDQEISDAVMGEMLGPFEVIAISRSINFNRKLSKYAENP